MAFGRILAETALGTLLGTVAAIVVTGTDRLTVPFGALVGFTAALRLRLRYGEVGEMQGSPTDAA